MEEPNYNFYGLGIAPKIIEILESLKFKHATPIQHQAIPLALEGKDVMGIAQTGTGKTMAFAIPTIQKLAQTKDRALVVVPTRELAIQVEESFFKIGRPFGIKTAVLIGGDPIKNQLRALAQHPRVLIVTPGRLIDLMEQRKVHLNDIRILVLDEADRMFDMGFSDQIETILRAVPKERQTLLFSATMPATILSVVRSHMRMPVSVEIARSGTTPEQVTHELFIIQNDMKRVLLGKLLAQFRGSVLLFCRTKMGARKISSALRQQGQRAAEIHSDRSLPQRREALEGFKRGKYRVLVATDIAARGIDVKGIELVINYDLPDDVENYVHRIGRTGRAGCPGHAISFATSDQKEDVASIERLIKASLPISSHPDVPAVQFSQARVRGGSWTNKSFSRRGGGYRRR
ncbi:MAG TPA: ATP-dependent helicase [Candidatus Omnitrophica bacterium]|nr:ATP-dependent helicase [Candidatus Omnitrophota bacterium]